MTQSRLRRRLYGNEPTVDRFLERARTLQRQCAIDGPPFDPHRYAEALGILVEEVDVKTLDGVLKCVGNNKFVVCLRRDASQEKKNFTLAHEIAHTLLHDLAAYTQRNKELNVHYDAEEERLCDLIASELLMPASVLRADLRKLLLNGIPLPDLLLSLRDRYKVSLQALLIRVGWVLGNIAIAMWAPNPPAINLSWITPQAWRQLTLCQTGHSSVELALQRRGETITQRDRFYTPVVKRWINRPTSSLAFRSGTVLSVIALPSKGIQK